MGSAAVDLKRAVAEYGSTYVYLAGVHMPEDRSRGVLFVAKIAATTAVHVSGAGRHCCYSSQPATCAKLNAAVEER